MRELLMSVVAATLFASGPGGGPSTAGPAQSGSTAVPAGAGSTAVPAGAGSTAGPAGAGYTPMPAASSTSSAPVLREVKVHLCDTYTFRPVRILVACGDGNARMVHLRWSEWTTARALGVGTWRQNDCRPDCADGTFRDYPVRVALAEPMGTGPRRFFGHIVADFPRTAPPAPAYRSGHAVLMNNGRLLRCPEKRAQSRAIAQR